MGFLHHCACAVRCPVWERSATRRIIQMTDNFKKHGRVSGRITGFIPWEVFANGNGPEPLHNKKIHSEKRPRSVLQIDGLRELNFV